MKRWLRSGASLLLLCSLVAACGGQSPSPADHAPKRASHAVVDRGCATFMVLGARGSTQDVTKNYGVGTEIRVTALALARLLNRADSSVTTRILPIKFDASPSATQAAYIEHVSAGAEMVRSRLTVLNKRCPDSRFVLMGFSQGAQVIHAAALDLPDELAARVGAAAMIADPRRNPDDRIGQWTYGSPAPRPGRLGIGTPIGANLRAIAISFCAAGDEICNGSGSPGDTPSATHKTFYEQPKNAQQTAQQLAKLL